MLTTMILRSAEVMLAIVAVVCTCSANIASSIAQKRSLRPFSPCMGMILHAEIIRFLHALLQASLEALCVLSKIRLPNGF